MASKFLKPLPLAKRNPSRANVRRFVAGLPPGYRPFLADLKARIQAARVKAALSVNRELIAVYWYIGKSIVERQSAAGWGKAVVERLAADLQKAFPGMEGFSPRNIWRMRAFYLAWTVEIGNLPRPVAEADGQNLPQPVAEIPWGHNVWLLEKVKDPPRAQVQPSQHPGARERVGECRRKGEMKRIAARCGKRSPTSAS